MREKRRAGRRLGVAALLAACCWPAAAQAAFPGENGKIAFHSFAGAGEGSEIVVMAPDGSGRRELTTTGDNVAPSWSPDGRRLAFTSRRDGNPELYVMDADGGNQTRVTTYPDIDANPSWSPDGRRIAFERLVNGVFDVHVVDLGGGGLDNLTDGHGGRDPAWSPDGRRIAFVSGDNVFVMNADGSGRLQVTNFSAPPPGSIFDPHDPDWSPDGTRIAYGLLTGGGRGSFFDSIRVMGADGIPHYSVGDVLSPAFSPDGSKIVVSCAFGALCTMPSDGSGSATELPGTDPLDFAPDWQPIVPGPRREDYRNASHFCKALRAFLGEQEFALQYRNHGGCVSRNR